MISSRARFIGTRQSMALRGARARRSNRAAMRGPLQPTPTRSAGAPAPSGSIGVWKNSHPRLLRENGPQGKDQSEKASNNGEFAAHSRDQTCPPLKPEESASAELFRAVRRLASQEIGPPLSGDAQSFRLAPSFDSGVIAR